ncbi:MAG: phenylalanine--tRNA ligase subunit alpha [Patescibacteria group bacterium]
MEIEQLEKQALTEIENCPDSGQLEELRIKYLGKKGLVAERMKTLPAKAAAERKTFGESLNQLKNNIARALELKAEAALQSPSSIHLDLTLPGTPWTTGHLHPVTQTITEIENIFQRLGYSRSRYGEVETDYYNFEALNIPRNHPARDEQETYYVGQDTVLTTHTSNGQVREMEKGLLPIRMLNISKCYRRQSDITHTPMFHQFEGLLVDQTASITDLKGTIDYFVKNYFGPKMQSRIRPYNFRFTEPSFEVDVTCAVCKGQSCTTCKDGWVELGGAGMVHPNVLRNGKVDHDKYSGFAFGWGVERCFMMKYNVNDIRLLYSTDLRILQQF